MTIRKLACRGSPGGPAGGPGVLFLAILLLGILMGCGPPGELARGEGELSVSPQPIPDLADMGVSVTALTPEFVRAYRVVPSCAPASLTELSSYFNAYGPVDELAYPPGVLHLADGDQHLFYYPDGAAEYYDTSHLADDAPFVQAVPAELLYQATEELLDDLMLAETGPMTLRRKGIEFRFTNGDPAGEDHSLMTHQTVVMAQRIDKLPAFGPGAQVRVVFPGDLYPVAFFHAIRCLATDEIGRPLYSIEAIKSLYERIDHGGAWNLLETRIVKVDKLHVKSVKLGYHVPAIGDRALVVDPVWAIGGQASGWDEHGEPTSSQLLWYEPALAHRPLPTVVP
jgi:hypothetical protein